MRENTDIFKIVKDNSEYYIPSKEKNRLKPVVTFWRYISCNIDEYTRYISAIEDCIRKYVGEIRKSDEVEPHILANKFTCRVHKHTVADPIIGSYDDTIINITSRETGFCSVKIMFNFVVKSNTMVVTIYRDNALNKSTRNKLTTGWWVHNKIIPGITKQLELFGLASAWRY